jgi:hypothetical protein
MRTLPDRTNAVHLTSAVRAEVGPASVIDRHPFGTRLTSVQRA